LLPKTCNFTICSIFCNSGHVGWCTASPDTILKLDTLVMILTKFGFHWSSTFREDFWKSLRRTTDDEGRQVMAIAHMTLQVSWAKKRLRKLPLFEGQQAKFTCLFQESEGFTILWLFTMRQRVVSCFSNHIMQMTPLFNIINSYNVISLFVHRNMYMFVFLFWHLACSFEKNQQHYGILIFYNNITWNFLHDRIIWFANRSTY
jgi:hypothetical protein